MKKNKVENVTSQDGIKEIRMPMVLVKLLVIIIFVITGAFIWLPPLLLAALVYKKITGKPVHWKIIDLY